MKGVNFFKYLIFVIPLQLLTFISFSQTFQYQPEKPGKFIFDNQLVKYPGVNVATLQKKLTSIVEWVHQNNEVVNHPTGFDALVDLTGLFGDIKKRQEDFGVRSIINFSFNHFFTENGVPCRATGNTAHGTEIFVNSPIYYISTQFDEAEFKTDDPPHLKQPLEKARENLRNYYTTAPVIKEFAPGVRLYASDPGTWFKGSLLVFNPNRPEIWIPVTVKEFMEVKLAYYKVKHEIDSINYEKMVAGWAKMNFNPDCWNRSLPATTVQYMSWQYRPETEEEPEKFKPGNGGLTDFVGLFFNSLPVERMGILIDTN